jgi:hypothetical protein
MKKEDIIKLVESDRFIPGIYNYCDRWCERCPQTMRCLNYSMLDQHGGPDAEKYDLTNEIFWQKMADILRLTLEMVRDTALEMGVDLDTMIDGPDAGGAGPEAENNIVHLIVHLAKHYADQVDIWFQSDPHGIETPSTKPHLHVLGSAGHENEVSVQDAVEVIRWYQHQIHVKMCRAFGSADKESDKPTEDFPSDADGSAKVALIGISRSISAWGVLLKLYPDRKAEILQLIRLLQNLRTRVDSEFPNAHSFVRPGFDDE